MNCVEDISYIIPDPEEVRTLALYILRLTSASDGLVDFSLSENWLTPAQEEHRVWIVNCLQTHGFSHTEVRLDGHFVIHLKRLQGRLHYPMRPEFGLPEVYRIRVLRLDLGSLSCSHVVRGASSSLATICIRCGEAYPRDSRAADTAAKHWLMRLIEKFKEWL
jgi:hypothetical protein